MTDCPYLCWQFRHFDYCPHADAAERGAQALPESWKLATMDGTAAETYEQAVKAQAEIAAAIADLEARNG